MSKTTRASRKKRVHIGSSFSTFLKQEGTFTETSATAKKRVLAWQSEEALRKQTVSKGP